MGYHVLVDVEAGDKSAQPLLGFAATAAPGRRDSVSGSLDSFGPEALHGPRELTWWCDHARWEVRVPPAASTAAPGRQQCSKC